MSGPRIVGVVASPTRGGRTHTAVAGVLLGVAKAGAQTSLLERANTTLDEVLAAFAGADAVVLGSPVYRASYSASLKELLERTERGKWGGDQRAAAGQGGCHDPDRGERAPLPRLE
jgi:FMN reductase